MAPGWGAEKGRRTVGQGQHKIAACEIMESAIRTKVDRCDLVFSNLSYRTTFPARKIKMWSVCQPRFSRLAGHRIVAQRPPSTATSRTICLNSSNDEMALTLSDMAARDVEKGLVRTRCADVEASDGEAAAAAAGRRLGAARSGETDAKSR